MAVSHYFNSFSPIPTGEQRLMEDLIVESIKIMGHNCYYMPRESFNPDDLILGENAQSYFNRAYQFEVYLANVEGYEGDGDYFSKFGLEIRDTSNFVAARRTFEKYVPSSLRIRPREGDLLYIPTMNKIFELKFVEEELMFLSLGKRNPYIYEMRAELFRFSNEGVNTGVAEIDDNITSVEYTIDLDVGNGTGDYNIGEVVYQGSNLAYATVQATVKDWDTSINKLYVVNIDGQFQSNGNVIGATSNTRYNLSTYDDIIDSTDYDLSDNRNLQAEANSVVIIQGNPFGDP